MRAVDERSVRQADAARGDGSERTGTPERRYWLEKRLLERVDSDRGLVRRETESSSVCGGEQHHQFRPYAPVDRPLSARGWAEDTEDPWLSCQGPAFISARAAPCARSDESFMNPLRSPCPAP